MSEALAAAEWRRGLQSLTAAQVCHSNGLYADAISRAYYAVMHTAKAALEIQNITVRTHSGVRSYFGRHIVASRLVEPEWADTISELGNLRRDADYNVDIAFSEADGRSACERAEAFLNRIRTLLPGALASSP